MLRKILFAAGILLVFISARADTQTVINGVTYDLTWGQPWGQAWVVWGGTRPTGDVVIEPYVKINDWTYEVSTIDKEAFWGCDGITSITIPRTIKKMDQSAFDGCKNLKKVFIEDLDAWLRIDFYGTNPLEFAHELYVNGQLLTDLYVPSKFTEILPLTFLGCNSLKSVHLPSTCKEIGTSAFANCENIPDITLPDLFEKVNTAAFMGCYGVETINFPYDIKTTGDYAFAYCTSLKSVYVPFPWPKWMTQGRSTFDGSAPEKATVYYAIDKPYAHEIIDDVKWPFGNFEAVPQCPTPRISISQDSKQIIIVCDAPDATIHATVIYEDTSEDNGQNGTVSLSLNGMYTITAYATAPGYYMSEATEGSVTLGNVNNKTNTTTHSFDGNNKSATPVITVAGTKTKPKINISGNTDEDHYLTYELFSPEAVGIHGPSMLVLDLDGHIEVKAQVLELNHGTSSDIAHLAFDWTDIKKTGGEMDLDHILLDDDAHTEYRLDRDIDEIEVTYTRTFPSTGTLAMYLPFDMEYDVWSEYGTAARLTGINEYDTDGDGTIDHAEVVFEELEADEPIEAHTMYLFISNDEAVGEPVYFECEALTLNATPEQPTTVTFSTDTRTYTFTGNYTMLGGLYDLDAYALSPAGKFVMALNPDQQLNPYRFYLTVSGNSGASSAPMQITANISGGATDALKAVSVDTPATGTYDILGRPASPSAKGLIIENNKLKYNK